MPPHCSDGDGRAESGIVKVIVACVPILRLSLSSPDRVQPVVGREADAHLTLADCPSDNMRVISFAIDGFSATQRMRMAAAAVVEFDRRQTEGQSFPRRKLAKQSKCTASDKHMAKWPAKEVKKDRGLSRGSGDW